MGSNATDGWGGDLPPPPEISETLKLAMELGRVPKGRLNIACKPKSPARGLVDA